MKKENATKRKEWIKNAAIVFLTVMLILTFFSNTIMNYSLPEVATAWVEPGTINAKIRGTGVLSSDDPYKISIPESRTIASVAVQAGDTVEKDQVLFYLEDKDSEELEQAEQELNDLMLAYTKEILSGTISNESYDNVQSGNISSTAAYQEKIEAAKQKYEAAVTNANNIKKQIDMLGSTDTSTGEVQTQLESAQAKLAQLETKKAEAKAAWEGAKAALEAMEQQDTTALEGTVAQALMSENEKKVPFENAKNALFDVIRNCYIGTGHAEEAAVKATLFQTDETGALVPVFEEKAAEAEYMGKLMNWASAAGAEPQLAALKTSYEEYTAAQAARIEAEKALNNAKDSNSEYTATKDSLAGVKTAYEKAEKQYNQQQTQVTNLQNQINSATGNAAKQQEELNRQYVEALAAQETAKQELDQLLTDIGSELNLSSQNSIIREKQEEIAELREKATGAVVKAPIAGIVTNVYKTAGEQTTPEEELAVMQPEGKGYSMSVSVTAEQAKKVTVGELAEVQNAWYYSDITVTLTGIRPDPASTGQNKLLVFDVTGDVQAGQNISISIGQRSASYDMLVPNSAVREDNNGKFILIVESKNSPLGNRYIATRVDVEVLGSDDTKTAINGALYGYEYVITTATQPVEAGKQVRLAEQ